MEKRTIIFETNIVTAIERTVEKNKLLEDHLEEIRRLVEPLKINTVRIKTEVEIK